MIQIRRFLPQAAAHIRKNISRLVHHQKVRPAIRNNTAPHLQFIVIQLLHRLHPIQHQVPHLPKHQQAVVLLHQLQQVVAVVNQLPIQILHHNIDVT